MEGRQFETINSVILKKILVALVLDLFALNLREEAKTLKSPCDYESR